MTPNTIAGLRDMLTVWPKGPTKKRPKGCDVEKGPVPPRWMYEKRPCLVHSVEHVLTCVNVLAPSSSVTVTFMKGVVPHNEKNA